MPSQRLVWSAIHVVVVLIAASVSRAQDDDARPRNFRDLLQVGNAVYLRSNPANNPLYVLQLLSKEQVAASKEREQENAAKNKRLERIGLALEMEHRLEKRAALLLEMDALDAELRRGQAASRYNSGTFYEVAHVGQDYVALKREGTERFVPFRSIQQMYRGDRSDPTLASTQRRRSSRSFAGEIPRGVTHVRLKHLDPTELASVIKKLFAEEDLEVQVENGAVRITSQAAVGRIVKSLVDRLDVKLGE